MSDHSIKITPDVTVHALLKAYPELEDVLIARPFGKLRNPILRRSIARIATLKHAATVGGVPLDQLIQTLREAVGQQASGESYADQDDFGDQPEWFASEKIAISLSEADEEEEDEMPLNRVLKAGQSVDPGQIVELTATFVPAPIIEIMQSKSYLGWVCQDDKTVRSYFLKPDAG